VASAGRITHYCCQPSPHLALNEGAVSILALQVMWGGTLFHVEDLPFQLASMPQHYSEFRKSVRALTVRAPAETPAQVKGLPAAS
jgi:hypothetical protein